MLRTLTLLLALAGCTLPSTPAAEAATELADFKTLVNKAAPPFSLPDLQGQPVSLADHAGKTVVLEWFNPGCPYVKAAHGAGAPLDKMAQQWADKGVVWLAINSGAPGKQGTGVDTNRAAAAQWSMDHPILIDEDGAVGKAYGAKTTPQMVVVDPIGVVRYAGGLDNAPMGKASGERQDYLGDALTSVLGGTKPATAITKPYGCSVKY